MKLQLSKLPMKCGKLFIQTLLADCLQQWTTLDTWLKPLKVNDLKVRFSKTRTYTSGRCHSDGKIVITVGNSDFYNSPGPAPGDDRRHIGLRNRKGVVCEALGILVHELSHLALFRLSPSHVHGALFNSFMYQATSEILGKTLAHDPAAVNSQVASDLVGLAFKCSL